MLGKGEKIPSLTSQGHIVSVLGRISFPLENSMRLSAGLTVSGDHKVTRGLGLCLVAEAGIGLSGQYCLF